MISYIGRVVVARILAAKSLVQLQVSSCLSVCVCKCLARLEISYEGPAGIRSGYTVGVSQTGTSLAESL